MIDVVIGNRVSAAAEVEGLDIPEMGVPGYVGVADEAMSPEHGAFRQPLGKPLPSEGR